MEHQILFEKPMSAIQSYKRFSQVLTDPKVEDLTPKP